MRKIFLMLAFAAIVGCDNDNDGFYLVPSQVRSAFNEQYPNAQNIHWRSRDGFLVAEFKNPTDGSSLQDTKAWYNCKGKWYMTLTDIQFSALPEAVQTSFEGSEWAEWYVDDVDKVEREEFQTLYVVEAEKRLEGKEQEIALYYIEDGTLFRSVAGDYDPTFEPSLPASTIVNYISDNYPDAEILDYDRQKHHTEVEILDGGVVREVYFDKDNAWLRTHTELSAQDLPDAVKQTIAASEWAEWAIDEVENVVDKDGEYYLVELESADKEISLRITPSGEIIK